MTSKIISSNQRNTSEYVSFKHKSMNQSILWLFRMFCWIPTGVIQENIWVLWTFSGLRWLHCIFKSHVGTLVWIREEAGQQNWGSLRSCSAGSFKYAGAKKLYKKNLKEQFLRRFNQKIFNAVCFELIYVHDRWGQSWSPPIWRLQSFKTNTISKPRSAT